MTGMPLAPGAHVRLKTDPARNGVLQAGERIFAGTRRVPVQEPDGRVVWLSLDALEPVPAAGESLIDRIAAGAFVAPDWLHRTLARIRVVGRLADIVYSMEATETEFYAHQFKPVLKLLNSPTDALLIADEVGLGKTIEAGLIWTELRARLDADRLLILCPKTLCEKWRDELDRRFGVDARIVGPEELLERLSPERRSARGFAAIASMQSLRPPRGWDRADALTEDEMRSPRVRLAQLLTEAAEGEPLLDLLVVDEAHHMRNPETLLYRLGEMTNAVATHRVFLSATPIHLRNRDLNSLLRLVDPDTFEFDGTLDRIISANAPLVEARDLVMNGTSTPDEIVSLIDRARGHDLLSDNRMLKLVREEVLARSLDRVARAGIAWRLENASQLANFVTRTRRRDVEELRIVREPKAPELELHEDERTFYDAITAEVTEYARHCAANERFLLSTPQRLLASSPAAASAWWEGRGRLPPESARGAVEHIAEEGEENVEQEVVDTDFRPLVARLSECAGRLGLTARLRSVDTKFGLLRSELSMLWKQEPEAKLIVFSSFKATLGYLQERLLEEGIACELMHGSVSEPRNTILRRFRERAGACVLLSSEVGSEGVDLQFCWIVVNYDLPWNPMRLEQRIGRVDRLGQQRDKVSILNLVYADTIDGRIYRRLYERLELGKRALGEFEAVLGEPIREMTQRLLDPELTEFQKNQTIDQTAQALENRARQTENLEAEAGSLVRHGDFVLRQIMEGRELNRWLSGEDILIYVGDRLRRSFEGCVIEPAPPGSATYRIELSLAARERFASFLNRHRLGNVTKLLDGDDRQRFRFTASVVRAREGKVENVSQVHPLVRFAAELDAEDRTSHRPQAVAARILKSDCRQPCEVGDYLILLRQWNATDSAGRATGGTRLAYAGVSLRTGRPVAADLAEALAMTAAAHGRPVANTGTDPRREAASTLADRVLNGELDARFGDYVAEIEADAMDRGAIRLRALDGHLKNKRSGLQRQLGIFQERAASARANGNERAARRNESLFAATGGRIRKLEERCALRRSDIESQQAIMPEESDVAALLIEVQDGQGEHHGG